MNQNAKSKILKYGLGFGFGVVAVVSTLSLVVVLQKNNSGERVGYGSKETQAPGAITFEEFITGAFSAKSFNGSWWSEYQLQWKDVEGNLVTWDIRTNESEVLVSKDLLTSFSGSGVRFMGFSQDESLLLFAMDIEGVWRHSFTAEYVVFNSNTNTSSTVTSKQGGKRLQYCNWVPRGEDTQALVYVSENNLFWKRDGSASETEDDLQISDDGEPEIIFNGIPDWVYEEEVLGVNYAHYIDSTGKRIAFGCFNDSQVEDFSYPHYGSPSDVLGSQYPQYKTVKYPKAGQKNPSVKLVVRELGEEGNKEVVPPYEVLTWGEYIYSDVTWRNNSLSITWMNRIQNESIISECVDAVDIWFCSTLFMQVEENGWIEIAPSPLYSDSDDSLLQILPSLQDADGRHYKHVALLTGAREFNGVVTKIFLTGGTFVVTRILAWEKEQGLVYFMGTDSLSPGSSHFYVVPDDGSQDIQCITCNTETIHGSVCLRNSISLNSGSSYYVHSCTSEVPSTVLRSLPDHNIIMVLQDNQELEDKLQVKQMPTRIDTSVEVEGGFTAPVSIMLPPGLDEGLLYPVLVYVYGGPGSQQVSQSFSVGWGEYLATSRGVIYVCIDGRGTGFQSDEHLFQVYKRLGTVEMSDQISVMRSLLETYPFMDGTRTSIWGWSYGGFATAMTLEQDTGDQAVFSCGISVAPVTSWLLYDSVYTERYMALPQENEAGYNNSVISGIENLKTKKWMLNHGVADDNVHFQHSMLLTKALERGDIQFEQHSYPDENHSLRGVRRFLYHAMDMFWEDCYTIQN